MFYARTWASFVLEIGTEFRARAVRDAPPSQAHRNPPPSRRATQHCYPPPSTICRASRLEPPVSVLLYQAPPAPTAPRPRAPRDDGTLPSINRRRHAVRAGSVGVVTDLGNAIQAQLGLHPHQGQPCLRSSFFARSTTSSTSPITPAMWPARCVGLPDQV